MQKGPATNKSFVSAFNYVLFLILFSSISLSANATLLSRLNGLAVYDTDSNLTWLADANAGRGTIYDNDPYDLPTSDGQMTWTNATAWTECLNVGGFTDWRLPSALNPDGSAPCFGYCDDSELSYLLYVSLGVHHSNSILDGDPASLALFSNIKLGRYGTSTETLTHAWYLDTNSGFLNANGKGCRYFAWAVCTGDAESSITAVPVPTPSTVLLVCIGLAGIFQDKFVH